MTAGRGRRRSAGVVVALAVLVAPAVTGCSALRHAVTAASPAPTVPPAAASQAPGPPLATASAGTDGTGSTPDPADPATVASYCFARWQSFDARTDAGLGAGVQRAAAAGCFTPDFVDQLTSEQGSTATQDSTGQAWDDLRAEGARSTVTVLAATPLANTLSSGRVVYLLNVRTSFTTTATGNPSQPPSVSTPTVTLLRDLDGRWRIAGADLSGNAGDAPGR